MASTVPYEGTLQERPQFNSTSSISVDTPPAAFGVNIAEAIGHLGTVTENAGKELFDRAYAMQELQLHANVNANLAKAQNDSLQESVAYSNLEGKAAVDGLGPHLAKLDQIREEGAKGLPPLGVDLYDSESRQSRFRMATWASTHAASEQKKYVVGSANARIASLENEAELDPDNPKGNADRLAQIKSQIEFKNSTVSGLKPDDPQWDQNIKEGESAFIGANIRGLAQKSPFKAQKLLDQAIADKSVVAGITDGYGRNNIQRLQDYVDEKLRTIGSRVAAHETMTSLSTSWHGLSDGTDRMSFSRGVQNFNPTNIGWGGYAAAQGAIGGKGADSGHLVAQFPSYEAGFQAAENLAGLKYRSGKTTAAELIAGQGGWTPGNMQAAQNVARGMGLGVNDDLQLNDPKQMRQFLSALTVQEVGPEGAKYIFGGRAGLPSSINATLKEARALGATIAESHDPGNPLFAEAVDQRVVASWENNERQQRDDRFNNQQTIDGVIVGGDQSGKIPTTVEELTSTPAAKEAWDQLPSSDQMRYMNILASNARGDTIRNSPTRLNNYAMLRGMAGDDPEKFLKADILGTDMTMSQKQDLVNLRSRVKKGEEADPNVSRALHIPGIAQQLSALNLTPSLDKDNYYLFSSTLGDEMHLWAQENKGKPPNQEQTEIIAGRLLQSIATGNWLFGKTQPYFESEPPYDWALAAQAEAQSKLGYTPTNQDIRRRWIQEQYQNQYGGTAGSANPK